MYIPHNTLHSFVLTTHRWCARPYFWGHQHQLIYSGSIHWRSRARTSGTSTWRIWPITATKLPRVYNPELQRVLFLPPCMHNWTSLRQDRMHPEKYTSEALFQNITKMWAHDRSLKRLLGQKSNQWHREVWLPKKAYILTPRLPHRWETRNAKICRSAPRRGATCMLICR